MFPNTFLINKKDLIIETGNFYRIYSTISDLKRNKLILINRTNPFFEKTSSKIKNAIIRKFEISEKNILEIKTNLKEENSKGRVKIEKIDFDIFLKKFFENNSSKKIVKKLTNIKGESVNITGITRVDNGISIIIFTDISLRTKVLESLINEINPLNNFYLKSNYPFLNSITFLSKKFDKKRLKIKNVEDKSLKHFKNSLRLVFENLIKMILKEKSRDGKILKIEVGLKSKNESKKILNKIVGLDYIGSSLANLNNIENYYLLKKSFFDLFDENIKNLCFEINGVPVFEQVNNIKNIIKKIGLNSSEILILRIFERNAKKRRFFYKYFLN